MDFPTNSLDSQQSLPSRGQTDDIATYVHTLEKGGRELADWASTVESWLGQFWGRDVWFFQDVSEPTGDTRFCESIPPASGMVGQKNTQSNWIFLKGLPSFPNGPTFQCLTCLICLWPLDRKGRNNTHLVDWDGTSRNSSSNHCFLSHLIALTSPLQRISPHFKIFGNMGQKIQTMKFTRSCGW